MALDIKLEEKSINSLGTLLTLEDKTVYGGGNPLRDTTNLFLYGTFKSSTEETTLSTNISEPLVGSEFNVSISKDGYYEFILIAIQDGLPTVDNEFGYSGGKIYKQVSGVDTEVTIEEAANDVQLLEKSLLPVLVVSRAAIKRNTLNMELVDKLRQNQNDRAHKQDIVYARERHDYVRALLSGAQYQWYQKNYMYAQEIIEAIEQYND